MLSHMTTSTSIWVGLSLSILLAIGLQVPGWLWIGFDKLSWEPIDMQAMDTVLTQLVVGSSEEFIFRGLLFLGLFIQINKLIPAAVVSSLCFSVVHFQSYSISQQWMIHLGIFSIGMILCYLYIVFKSLWVPILLHSINNICVELLVADESPVGNYLATDIWQSMTCVLVCLVSTIYLYQYKWVHVAAFRQTLGRVSA